MVLPPSSITPSPQPPSLLLLPPLLLLCGHPCHHRCLCHTVVANIVNSTLLAAPLPLPSPSLLLPSPPLPHHHHSHCFCHDVGNLATIMVAAAATTNTTITLLPPHYCCHHSDHRHLRYAAILWATNTIIISIATMSICIYF